MVGRFVYSESFDGGRPNSFRLIWRVTHENGKNRLSPIISNGKCQIHELQ